MGEAHGSDIASMRPRVFPAEDLVRRRLVQMPGDASMRPRVFPAEDPMVFAEAS